MSTGHPVQTFSDGDVRLWIEQKGAIHLKAVSSHGDPAELTAKNAREIAAALIAAAEQIDDSPAELLMERRAEPTAGSGDP